MIIEKETMTKATGLRSTHRFSVKQIVMAYPSTIETAFVMATERLLTEVMGVVGAIIYDANHQVSADDLMMRVSYDQSDESYLLEMKWCPDRTRAVALGGKLDGLVMVNYSGQLQGDYDPTGEWHSGSMAWVLRQRPHSRACGLKKHDHGEMCSGDCSCRQ